MSNTQLLINQLAGRFDPRVFVNCLQVACSEFRYYQRNYEPLQHQWHTLFAACLIHFVTSLDTPAAWTQ